MTTDLRFNEKYQNASESLETLSFSITRDYNLSQSVLYRRP